jgi:pimeloyl-ACP methyl ester carboxylesterase
MRSTRGVRGPSLSLVVAVIAALGVLVPVAGAAVPVPVLDWAACPAGSPGKLAGGFVCATAAVPLDYRSPSGKSISLALVKHPATGPGPRVGTLFVNPGGPGGMGTAQIPGWIHFFPTTVLERFDVVSWDPRGIGESTAVQCFANKAAEGAFLGESADFPVGAKQQRAYIATWKRFGSRCAQRNGRLLKHVSTAETARDLELLRRAVGDPALTYLGLSYGTFLGATYANLFPNKVRALVLDGNVAPDAWTAGGDRRPRLSISLRIGSDSGSAKALNVLLKRCGQVSTADCAFSAGTAATTKAKFDTLLERLRKRPIMLGSGASAETVTYAQLLGGLSDALDVVQPFKNTQIPDQSIQGWSGAATVLQRLWKAAGLEASSTGSALADSAHTPASSGAQAVEAYAGPEQALSVICGESPNPREPRAYIKLAKLVLRRAGPVGLSNLWGDEPCATWPARAPVRYRGPWDTPTAHPILVIGNTTDPATPLKGSVKMVKQLADARLLTVRGYGHSAFLNPSTCANDYTVAYLIDGALPPAGTVCPQDAAPFTAESTP